MCSLNRNDNVVINMVEDKFLTMLEQFCESFIVFNLEVFCPALVLGIKQPFSNSSLESITMKIMLYVREDQMFAFKMDNTSVLRTI